MFKKRLLSALLVGSLTASGFLVCLRPPAAYAASSIPVTIMQQDNGTAACSSSSATEGSTVTVKVSPSSGYSSGGIAAVDSENNAISVAQVNAGEYSFVMPGTEVTVVPIFLAGGGETSNTAAPDNTSQSGAETETSIPASAENGANGITESVVPSENQTPVHTPSNDAATGDYSANAAEDPAAVDIANHGANKVVTATDENASAGTSTGASNNVSNHTETQTPSQSDDPPASDSSDNQSSSSVIVSADDTNGNDYTDSGDATISSESKSESSGALVMPDGGSGIVSGVVVVPSENGAAEADTLPVGTVVVPGSSEPQMALSDSGTQGAKKTTVVSSVTGENKITSSITGTTKVPNILNAILSEPVLAMSTAGKKTVEKKGVPAEKILSAYVPTVLPIQASGDGEVITPEKAVITSGVKSRNIRVASAEVRYCDGWAPMNDKDVSDNDSEYQVSVSLRQSETDAHGKISLEENDWLIRPGKSLPINLKAKISDDIMVTESPVSIEFVLDWA